MKENAACSGVVDSVALGAFQEPGPRTMFAAWNQMIYLQFEKKRRSIKGPWADSMWSTSLNATYIKRRGLTPNVHRHSPGAA